MTSTAIRRSNGAKVFTVCNTLILLALTVVTLYPFLYVLFASFSSASMLMKNQGALLWFRGFSTAAYSRIFSAPTIYIGYRNTLFYVIVGTVANLFFTILGAYALSRKGPMLNRFFTLMFTFTMYFSGGMVPTFLLYNDLGLFDNRWALILNGLISTYNMIIMITAFREIPAALEESARMDGANDWTILLRVVIPLSMPTIMVICLYYAVGRWNSWFPAMIYLQDRTKYPLQLFLREILLQEQMTEMMASAGAGTMEADSIAQTLKYAMIIVSTLPVLVIYPYIQRYFVKGIMIGAVKG